MNSHNPEINRVLSLIDNADLPHPSGALLSQFITEALDPFLAADFLSTACSNGDDKRPILLGLAEDWTYVVECASQHGCPPPAPTPNIRKDIAFRDGNRCCITGKPGRRWDPLIVHCILPVPSGWIHQDKPRILDMLGAFFGPGYRDWWLSYARNPAFMINQYENHWLVTKSAALAFSRGVIKLQRRQPSMIEYEVHHVPIGFEQPIKVDGEFPLLGDRSRRGIPTVDARFVGTHARLCRSLQYVDLARKFALNNSLVSSHCSPAAHQSTSYRSRNSALVQLLVTMFLGVWLLVPARVRLIAYRLIRQAARYLYESDTDFVQKLPFGLYLKKVCILDSQRNELNAMNCVRRYTSIPIPKPLDFVTLSGAGDNTDHTEGYLLMTRVPGAPLSSCYEALSDHDVEHITAQLQDYVTQMRAIPNEVNLEHPFCNTLGEAIRDHGIGNAGADIAVGPFPDETAFNQKLRCADDPARQGHRAFFTHADLNPRNIMVQELPQPDGTYGWRVTGILDWETAGFYPEYWEYTKALYEGFRWTRRYANIIHRVFRAFGDYSKEFAVEQRARDAVSY